MKMAPNMKLLVNADDSLSTYLAMDNKNPYTTYGISEQVFKDQNSKEIREGRFCKRCGHKMEYKFYHYSQLGDYYCPKCGFKRPKPEFDASHIDMSDGLAFDVKASHIKANYRGFIIFTTFLPYLAQLPWQESQQKTLIKCLEITLRSLDETNSSLSMARKLC